MSKKGFASDNNSGVLPEVIDSIAEVNKGHVVGYGDDVYTKEAISIFKKEFGQHIDVNFVFSGTAANVLGIMAATRSYNSVICSELAHINQDECGAPEKIAGVKVIAIPHKNGKITVEEVKKQLFGFDFEHHSQPGLISISQVTELGTVYSPQEIKELSDLAHKNNMKLHIDGARIANAAVSLGLSFKEFTTDCGVDVLSFGGTKNGLMMGEALIFFDKELSDGFKYIRKQHMQLYSKMRFVAAQFIAYFKNDLWKNSALHANNMAEQLAKKLSECKHVTITQPVQANGVFAIIPHSWNKILQEKFFFYVWDEFTNEVRWMTSFDTIIQDIDLFISEINKLDKSE